MFTGLLKSVLKSSWTKYKSHFFELSVIYMAIFLVLVSVNQITRDILQSGTVQMKVASSLINFFTQSFAGLGIVYMVLQIDAGKSPSLKDFLSKTEHYISFTATLTILSLLFYVGLYFFIAPALIVLMYFGLALYISVDKGVGVFESFAGSYKLTKGRFVELSLFFLILILINIFASFTLFGLLISVPFTNIAMAIMYKNLQNNKPEKVSLSQKMVSFTGVSLLFVWGIFVFVKRGAFQDMVILYEYILSIIAQVL